MCSRAGFYVVWSQHYCMGKPYFSHILLPKHLTTETTRPHPHVCNFRMCQNLSPQLWCNESNGCLKHCSPLLWRVTGPTLKHQFSSVQFSRSVVSDSTRPRESQHTRPPCPSPTPGVHSDSRPSSQLCHQYPLIPSGLDRKLDGKWQKFIPLHWANTSTCKGCKAGSLEQSPWKGRNSDTLRAGWEVDHSCFYNYIELHHYQFITLLKPIRALRL